MHGSTIGLANPNPLYSYVTAHCECLTTAQLVGVMQDFVTIGASECYRISQVLDMMTILSGNVELKSIGHFVRCFCVALYVLLNQ